MAGTFDVIVIGGGIAGASAASELAALGAAVVLLEMEEQLAYHSTGRSAAMFIRNYGPPTVRALSAGSYGFLADPPADFAEHPLIAPRGTLIIAEPGREADLAAVLEGAADMEALSADAALGLVPLLRRERIGAAAYEPEAQDIDVHALHSGYIKRFRAAGGRVVTRAEVRSLAWEGAGWTAETAVGGVSAPVVVNTAGAWADAVAERAGLGPLGIQPKRRTAILVEGPGAACDCSRWPVVADLDDTWYMRPEAGGKLMVSPADETPVGPCDVQPEELDIAIAVDRFERAVDLEVRRVEHSWAGLRSFAPDGTLVVGFDPRAEGFFWLAGQGGYGIQTAPAASRLAAALIAGQNAPDWCAEVGLDSTALAPQRLIDGTVGVAP